MALVKGLHSGEYDTPSSERLINALVLGRTQSLSDPHPTPSLFATARYSARQQQNNNQWRSNNNDSSTHNNSYSCLSLDPIEEQYILTGDRNGNINLYHTSLNTNQENSTNHPSSMSSSHNNNNSSYINSSTLTSSYGQLPIQSTIAPSLATVFSSPTSSSSRSLAFHEQQYRQSKGITTIQWYTIDTGLFITGGYNNGLLTIWDTNKFMPVHNIQIGSNSTLSSTSSTTTNTIKPTMINCTKMSSISSSHALVAVGTDQPGLQLIDLVSSSSIHTLQGHADGISSIDWHPLYEYLLISGSYDGSIRLWDIRKNNKETCLLIFDQYKTQTSNTSIMSQETTAPVAIAHTGGVHNVHFSTTDITGNTIFSCGRDNRPRCWQINQQINHPYKTKNLEEDNYYEDVNYVQNNITNGHFIGWNTLRSYISGLEIPRLQYRSMVPLLTAASGYNETGILCITGTLNQSTYNHNRSINSPFDNTFLSSEGIISIFDIETGQLLTELKGHHSIITGLNYCKKSQELYSCGDDGMLYCWKPLLLQEKRSIVEFTEH